MRKYLLLVVALLALAALVGPVAQAATNTACGYVYTNDDNFGGVNSTTVFKCDTVTGLTRVTTVNTGGNGQGGGYFGADRIKLLAKQNTLFVNDSGSGTISIFDISNPAAPVLKNTFNDSQGGDASFAAGGPCLVAGFANTGVVNTYKSSGFNLTLVSSQPAGGSVDGLAATKLGTKYYVAWATLAGYGYATIDGSCTLGTPTMVGGPGGEAGVTFSADGSKIYFGVANGSSTTIEEGTFPGGALTQYSYTSGGFNSNNVIVNAAGTCAYASNSWSPLGLTAIPMAGGIPNNTNDSVFVPDNTGNFYQGPAVFHKSEKGIFDLTTSGTNLETWYMTGTSCKALKFGGNANTNVSGPFSMSSVANPQYGY